jgi:hypothetical protein
MIKDIEMSVQQHHVYKCITNSPFTFETLYIGFDKKIASKVYQEHIHDIRLCWQVYYY